MLTPSLNKCIKFLFEFNYSYDDFIKNSLYNNLNKIKNELHIFTEKKFIIINSVQKNLTALLIHNYSLETVIKYSFIKCNDNSCNICNFSTNHYFLSDRNLILHFRSFSNCTSKAIVYIIKCLKCNCFYIGESSRLVKDRIKEHLNSIKKFKINLNESLINISGKTEIAIHFNKSGHNLNEDFKFYIFETKLNNNEIRRSIETDLINLFKTFKVKILNRERKQPKIESINYLTFQTKF